MKKIISLLLALILCLGVLVACNENNSHASNDGTTDGGTTDGGTTDGGTTDGGTTDGGTTDGGTTDGGTTNGGTTDGGTTDGGTTDGGTTDGGTTDGGNTEANSHIHIPDEQDKTKCKVCGEPLFTTAGLQLQLNSDYRTYTLTGLGSCAETDIYIGICEDGKTVTAIAEGALDRRQGDGKFPTMRQNTIKSIVIGDCVKTIGKEAFKECAKLETVILPEGLTSIGSSAFYGCTSLKDIAFPSTVNKIEESMFSGCSSLESFSIERNILTIGANAFRGCTSLTRLNFAAGDSNKPWQLQFVVGGTALGGGSVFTADFSDSRLYSDPAYAADIFTKAEYGAGVGETTYYYQSTWYQ